MKTPGAITPAWLTNILFATDLSSASDAALLFVLQIARHHGSKIYAVHVIEPEMYSVVSPAERPRMVQDEEHNRKEGRRRLEEALKGTLHEVVFERGEVWPTLSELIRNKEIDLLVIGTHGRTGIHEAALGSIAEAIFWQAPCPVLTVDRRVSSQKKSTPGLNRILYATDFSVESLAAVPFAISWAREHGAELTLLHSIEEAQPGQLNSALLTLRDLVPLGTELSSKPRCILERGQAADAILEVAARDGSDLIILGVRGARDHFTTATHLARSTVYKVLTRAACPVLTVRG